uniref:Uncharacterized protein n=1 Tax=Panagrolaimus sp. ES5 TaxID=591445 RepID=A0AC34G003_9BILA
MRPNGGTTVQSVVRIGPFSAVDRINAENRAIVLTRILKAVNGALCYMYRDIVCRSYCISMLILVKGGFSYPESGFRNKVLQNKASDEEYGDQSKKPRIPLTSFFLIEALNGIHYAIFNGYADIGLRALDAVHNRAQYELYGDVLIITNALHDSLLQNQSIRMMLEIEPVFLSERKLNKTKHLAKVEAKKKEDFEVDYGNIVFHSRPSDATKRYSIYIFKTPNY